MAEIIYRFPSKVSYSYVEIRTDGGEELPTPERVAAEHVDFFLRYKAAEEAGLSKPKAPPTLKLDDVLDEDDTDKAAALITKTLGATPVEEGAPWDDKPKTTEEKPWDSVSDDAWDFS